VARHRNCAIAIAMAIPFRGVHLSPDVRTSDHDVSRWWAWIACVVEQDIRKVMWCGIL
jgi:hypothetical protein